MVRLNRREWLAGAGSLVAATQVRGALRPAIFSSGLPNKADFPITRKETYLNNAGFHPLSTPCVRAGLEYLNRRAEGTVPGKHPMDEAQMEVKSSFAALVNASPSEISCVPSTMVGENLVVAGLGIARTAGNVVTDALHFEGSLYMYRSLQEQGLDLRIVMPRDWRIDLTDLEKAIDRNTKLVAVSLVSFLNGFQHDLKAVCDLAHSRGAYVYADIVQAAGAVPIDVHETGVDFCACSSYKWLMGEFGLGFFYVRQDLLDKIIHRTQYGWQQFTDFEYHFLPYDQPAKSPVTWRPLSGAAGQFEVGTMSNTTVACLARSLKYIQELGVGNIQAHTQSLTQHLQGELPRLGFKPMTPPESRSPIITFAVKDPETIVSRLNKANVKVKVDQHYMRISPSIYNDETDVDKLLSALS
jgi:selenocysteine lyase/cysteine desulfurase